MKNRLKRTGAALLAGVMLLGNVTSLAEEKRLGDYIYVPAMSVASGVGSLSLRVEGMALGEDGAQPVVVDALPGAEFGVYVFSGDGELTPWANPLYPAQPMRIRTGEGETNFTLPQGMEFYLRQESAPAGYLFDETALYKVEGEQIVVVNHMPGELAIDVKDTLERPVEGASLRVTSESGDVFDVVTDENGEALVLVSEAGAYTVEETALPQGVFDALRVRVNGEEAEHAGAQVALASRASVAFEHPASGSVELTMSLFGVDENAQTVTQPLQGVAMEILGDTAASVVTDANGRAEASLLEGMYTLRFSYEGGEDVVLPYAEAQMIVESGAATVIDLSAARAQGRIAVTALCEKAVEGGSISFEFVDTGDVFGPYAFDEEGIAVTDALAAGEYRVADVTAPENTQLGDAFAGGMQMPLDDAIVAVESGKASRLDIELLTMEKQTYGLYAQQIGNQGEIEEMMLAGAPELTLLDAQGREVAPVQAENSEALIEALSGEYMLRMDARTADELGLSQTSRVFTLPSDEETIVFASAGSRLILVSVDHNGEPVAGASYSVMDITGMEVTVNADADAQAVTPLLAPGEMRIETVSAPADHDEAQVLSVTAEAGEAVRVQVMHPAYGEAQFSVRVQSVSPVGNPVFSPLAGVRVRIYSVAQDGETLVDTGLELSTSEDGTAVMPLRPGLYAAIAEEDDLPEGYAPGATTSFAIENTKATHVNLTSMDALGGVRVQLTGGTLSDEQLAQVRFELVSETGESRSLSFLEGYYPAAGLEAGSYTLRQTQIPQGYALAKEQTIQVIGGEVTKVAVPLEEYAVLEVEKTGITFNDRMQTFIVPLSGQYGVYTMENGEMTPYPSAENQLTVWANVTAAQIAQGRTAQLRLPASVEGTTYYLREIGSASGFAADEEYHSVTLAAGETAKLSCAVSSDRGFFAFSQTDAKTHEHVAGGEYELISCESGEVVLSFTLGEGSYQNAMAVPVGEYILRQLSAGEGYAMSEESEQRVLIEPYLTQGGAVAQVAMTSAKIPADPGLESIADFYTAQQQGMTLIMVEGGALDAGETLRVPQMTVRVSSENGERTDVGSVVLGGASDAQGGSYVARVEYCLEGGGWQPSDARMTGELTAPVAVSLMDVEDDIEAIRVTYIYADTGEEKAGSGFNPGQISLYTEIGTAEQAEIIAEAAFGGEAVYRTRLDEAEQTFARSVRREIRFAAQGAGEFTTASAGRDGRITGVVFFDENADGVMSASEASRYAGMTVSLMTGAMETVATCRTDGSGRYEFAGISGGEYTVQFEAGEKLVFSSGDGFTQHVVSGVEDKRLGTSGVLRFDGDHTDYVVNAGCIYAAQASGVVMEKTAEGRKRGYDGLNIDVMRLGDADEEPSVVMTDDTGAFRMTGLLPGEYEILIALPDGYLCREAEDGEIRRRVTLSQGDEALLGEFEIALSASVSGGVYVDDDADGMIGEGAQAIAGVQVALLAHADGHTQEVARTTTDEWGGYAFDGLMDGEYSVLFELEDDWTFTRFGGDSLVYGAVSATGSTQRFALRPGEEKQTVDAGVTKPASLEVLVFADEHADGNKGVYDVGLAGVTISLIRQENGEDAEEVSLVTGSDGLAAFDGLAPGEYVIAYQMPGIYRATKQIESSTYNTSCVPQTTLSTGRSAPFTLAMGETGQRKYIGAMLSGRISGMVYYDNDADARIGEEEPGCAGVLIELLKADGSVLDTRTSDESGEFLFEGLAPGRYSVRFSAQQECGFSGSERSMTRGGVQKSDESVSVTRALTVTAGGKIDTVHAGVVRMASIAGTLFVDANADSVMGEGENPLAGVSVHLMNGAARSILRSTATDEQGNFSFDRVTPGTYLIRVDAPEGYVFSGSMQGSPLALDDVREGRGYSQAFELLGGAHAQGVSFGLLTQGTIGGRVWIDEDYDGYAGEREEGLRSAQVTLRDLDGSVIASKTTIRSGEFVFDGLMPGTYSLDVDVGEGYVFTTNTGESMMDRTNRSSATAYLGELSMGGKMDQLMIGAIRPASVSGMVFIDEDNDGRRKDGDDGAQGVVVTLTMLSGADEGEIVTTKTNASGEYTFSNVMPGRAKLRFDIPEGYAFAKNAGGNSRVSCVPMTNALSAESEAFDIVSGQNKAETDAGILPVGTISGYVWQDETYNGKPDSAEGGVAGAKVKLVHAANGQEAGAAVTDEQGRYSIGFVRPGEYTLGFELPDGMIFTTAGVGAMSDSAAAESERFTVRMGESLEDVNAGAIIPAGISSSVIVDWNENGRCDEDEPGFEGAVITVMQGGTVVTSTKTLEDGSFDIDSLRPGTYRVRVALPEDALFSLDTTLTLAHRDALEGETGEFALDMGQHLQLEPAAVVLSAEVGGLAWMDENTNGKADAGEPLMTGVTAELLDASGQVLRTVRTEENGRYVFDALRSGTYAVRFTLGADALFADQTGEPGGSSVPVGAGNVGTTLPFALSQEDVIDEMNVGGIYPGRIGDTVFLDSNRNGLMDYREVQIPGVKLLLMSVGSDGTLVETASTISDEYGYYCFDDLRPGSYVVRVPLDENDVLTVHFGAPLGEIDSDVNPETGDTDVISLVSGQTLRNIDIGFISR